MQSGVGKRLVIVAVIAALIASYFLFDLGQYFSLDYLKESREQFQALYREHAFAVIGVYFLIYVTATALALPAATVITLAGGLYLVCGPGLWSFLSQVQSARLLRS